MEEVYFEETTTNLFKAGADKVKFLLDFSKSLKVIDYQEISFDSVMN